MARRIYSIDVPPTGGTQHWNIDQDRIDALLFVFAPEVFVDVNGENAAPSAMTISAVVAGAPLNIDHATGLTQTAARTRFDSLALSLGFAP